MTIQNAIQKEFAKAIRRGWDKIYVFVDFHEVILLPDYQSSTPIVDYYPFAKELLQHLTARKDVCLIAWTCSHPHQLEVYLDLMSKDQITFDYINKNPEVSTDEKYGYYEDKPYYNIVLDDKGGIQPDELESILKTFELYKLTAQPNIT